MKINILVLCKISWRGIWKEFLKKGSMLQNVKTYTVLDYSYFFSELLFGMLIKEIEETYRKILKNIDNA